MTRFPRAALIALLGLLTSGLFAMHTLGHGESGVSMTMAGVGPVASVGGPHVAMAHLGAVVTGSATAVTSLMSHHSATDDALICLAVLCCLLAVLVAMVWARRGRPIVALAPRSVLDRSHSRGPPGAAIGLMLADLSVSRN